MGDLAQFHIIGSRGALKSLQSAKFRDSRLQRGTDHPVIRSLEEVKRYARLSNRHAWRAVGSDVDSTHSLQQLGVIDIFSSGNSLEDRPNTVPKKGLGPAAEPPIIGIRAGFAGISASIGRKHA